MGIDGPVAFRKPWVDDAVAAILRQNRVKTSGDTFSGTQIHAPKNVCHVGRLLMSPENS
jgi:hypothetical protein